MSTADQILWTGFANACDDGTIVDALVVQDGGFRDYGMYVVYIVVDNKRYTFSRNTNGWRPTISAQLDNHLQGGAAEVKRTKLRNWLKKFKSAAVTIDDVTAEEVAKIVKYNTVMK